MVYPAELVAATNGNSRESIPPLGIQQSSLLRDHPHDPDGGEGHRRVGLPRYGVDRLIPLGKRKDDSPPLPFQ